MIVGGAGAAAGGSKVTINHLSAGRIPEGATVERAVPTPLSQGDTLELDLNSADYATARAVANAINANKGAGIARALDGRVVKVQGARRTRTRASASWPTSRTSTSACRAGRQDRDERPHRLHRDEPGRDARRPAPWRTAACR